MDQYIYLKCPQPRTTDIWRIENINMEDWGLRSIERRPGSGR